MSFLEWSTPTCVSCVIFLLFYAKTYKKHKIPFLVIKKGRRWMIIISQNLQRWIIYLYYAPFSCIFPLEWSTPTSLMFLTILCENVLKKHKIQFLVTKRGQKWMIIFFFWIFRCDLYIDFMLNFHIALLRNDLCLLL